jgi:hypothetical protein
VGVLNSFAENRQFETGQKFDSKKLMYARLCDRPVAAAPVAQRVSDAE